MSKSLQDQLLSLGLAKKETGKKSPAKHAKPKSRAARPGGAASGRPVKKAADNEEMALARAYALRQREEKRQAEAAKRKKQEDDKRRRELNTALKVLVKEHRLNDPNAEVARNFMYKGRIRKINLTPEQLKLVNQGDLGVVYLLGSYHLLPAEQVDAVRQLSAEHVPDLSGASDDDEEFPVPDDLIW
jgi:uncharacterized protein YaiL (DUF2058 family)